MNAPILTPLDYTGSAEEVVSVAVKLARGLNAPLILMYVVELPSTLPPDTAAEALMGVEARQELAALGRQAEAMGASVEIMVRSGEPTRQILAVAARRSAQLIVMGTHGRTGLRRLLAGSIAESVLRHANCPVTVVRTQQQNGLREPSPAHQQAEAETMG